MSALPIFLVFLLAVGYAQADECDDVTYMSCQEKMNAALGLTDTQPWHNPEVFRNQVEKFYQNNPIDGTQKVCKAFREFKNCMGVNYNLCINPSHFVISSVSPYSAYQFVSTFNTMHFTCGAGFQIMISRNACMKTVWNSSNSQQLYACRTKFERWSDANPEDSCSAGNTYMDCWENHFRTICGSSLRDAQFWGCEYARVNIFTRYPACNNRCVLPYNGGIIG